MAQQRSWFLNRIRDGLMMPRVNYTPATWVTSAAATDPLHPETILAEDLYEAMKLVASDGRGKEARKRLRVIADQFEYPLPPDCMTVKEILYKRANTWQPPLEYIRHSQFYYNFNETAKTNVPTAFTLEQTSSRAVHASGTITTASGDPTFPPILIDSNANFGITISGEEIAPGDYVFNITDNSQGYVYYLYASSWKVEANCDADSSTTTLYDADASFVTNGVAVGDIIYRSPMPADDHAYAIVTKVAEDTLTFTRLYNHEAGFAENDTYKVGTSDTIYLTLSGLVKDTEEGLIGGAENDFDVDDEYQIEDKFETLDTLLLSPVPLSSDTAGERNLMLVYYPLPEEPLNYYDPIELSEAYSDAIIAKAIEYANARERGETKPYEYLLDRACSRRTHYNVGREGVHRRARYQGASRQSVSFTIDATDYR